MVGGKDYLRIAIGALKVFVKTPARACWGFWVAFPGGRLRVSRATVVNGDVCNQRLNVMQMNG